MFVWVCVFTEREGVQVSEGGEREGEKKREREREKWVSSEVGFVFTRSGARVHPKQGLCSPDVGLELTNREIMT